MIELTAKETQKLRDLLWLLKDAQTAFQKAAVEIGRTHGIDTEKERWNLTDDFRSFYKVKP